MKTKQATARKHKSTPKTARNVSLVGQYTHGISVQYAAPSYTVLGKEGAILRQSPLDGEIKQYLSDLGVKKAPNFNR